MSTDGSGEVRIRFMYPCRWERLVLPLVYWPAATIAYCVNSITRIRKREPKRQTGLLNQVLLSMS